MQASLATTVCEKKCTQIELCNKGLDNEHRDCVIHELQMKLAAYKDKNHLLKKQK
jgi:hypothetical protein